MFSKTIIALVASALIANAAPLAARSYSYSNGTTSTSNPTMSTGTPSIPSPVPYAAPAATIYPDFTSQYNSRTGAVDFHTARGYVSRNPKNGGADTTTLVTFMLDAKYTSNNCQLVFDLADSSSTVSGSKKAQLFTSLAPATSDSESWPSGNLRNQALGSIDVVKGGRATWEAGSGPGATANGFFPCSAIAGHIYGGEIVPQGDEVEFSWPAGKDGIKIVVW